MSEAVLNPEITQSRMLDGFRRVAMAGALVAGSLFATHEAKAVEGDTEIVTIDNTNTSGDAFSNPRKPSMEIGADGNPVVAFLAYNAQTNRGSVMLLEAGNSSASAGNHVKKLAEYAGVGTTVELVIPESGIPTVFYADTDHNGHKIQCIETVCNTFEDVLLNRRVNKFSSQIAPDGTVGLAYSGSLDNSCISAEAAQCKLRYTKFDTNMNIVSDELVGQNASTDVGLAFDATTGNPQIAFNHRSDVLTALCKNDTCKFEQDNPTEITALDVKKPQGTGLSAVDTPDGLRSAYGSITTSEQGMAFRVAACLSDSDCKTSGAVNSSPDSQPVAAKGTSIQSLSNKHLAAVNGTTRGLSVVDCPDYAGDPEQGQNPSPADCANVNYIGIVDSNEDSRDPDYELTGNGGSVAAYIVNTVDVNGNYGSRLRIISDSNSETLGMVPEQSSQQQSTGPTNVNNFNTAVPGTGIIEGRLSEDITYVVGQRVVAGCVLATDPIKQSQKCNDLTGRK